MLTAVNSASLWKALRKALREARFIEEITRSVERAEEINKNAEVKTRQLTPEEFAKIFGDNPNYIKEIEI